MNHSRIIATTLSSILVLLISAHASAQNAQSLPEKFALPQNPIELGRYSRKDVYFDAVGRKAAIFARESGTFESWVFPMKLFHNAAISISIEGQDSPIDFSSSVDKVIVRPESTTLVATNQLFTIKATYFTPINEQGSIILLDIDTARPLTLTISFVPDLKPMWPGGLGGQSAGWRDDLKAFVISESRRKYNAFFGSPGAVRGVATPAHQLASGALRFDIKVDPKTARNHFYPLIIAGGINGRQPVIDLYNRLAGTVQEQYQATFNHYRSLREKMMSIETPEPALNLAFEWAKAAMDKGMIDNPELGYGLVAGWGPAEGGARPGFGWFFGGDAAINSYAMTGYGDFESMRAAFRFLAKFQRADGKITHEISQAAGMIKWFEEYPYAFYHADTTPFYIAAVYNLYRQSGDIKLIEELWPNLKNAYQFCIDNDSDGDGILENSKAGLGASELGSLLEDLHQDIYLAATNLEASFAIRELAEIMKDTQLRDLAEQKYQRAFASLNELYWNQTEGRYIYALTKSGKQNTEVTAWAAVPMMFGQLDARRASLTIRTLSSSQISSDWGTRMLTNRSPAYDPMAYNNGGVWPFLTGFVASAEYAYRHNHSGLAHLRQLARMTFDHSLGFHHEILSGDFYRPLDESVPHQLFSSGMVITPFIRGLLGLRADAPKKSLRLSPQIPASWDKLSVRNYLFGKSSISINFRRTGLTSLSYEISKDDDDPIKLQFEPSLPAFARINRVLIDGKAARISSNQSDYLKPALSLETTLKRRTLIEISFTGGIEIEVPDSPTQTGDRTSSLKILEVMPSSANSLNLSVEGLSGKTYKILARAPNGIQEISGAAIKGDENGWKAISIEFPAAEGDPVYQVKIIQIRPR
ncbi:MAG: hypothetical protein IPO77_05055 [Acidobacteria bacterium]|nr:hypothetical protein [Acidobacteriota bacterium]